MNKGKKGREKHVSMPDAVHPTVLPDLRGLTFREFSSQNCGRGNPGVFLVKRNGMVIKVSGSTNNAYNVALRYIKRCKQNDRKDAVYTIACALVPSEMVTEAIEAYQEQWNNIALDDL